MIPARVSESPSPTLKLPATPQVRTPSELFRRIASAIVLLPVVVGLIFWGGLPFACLLALVAGVAVHELCSLALRPLPAAAWWVVACAAALPPLAQRFDPFLVSGALFLLCLGGLFEAALWGPGKDPVTAVRDIPWLILGLLYAALPLALVGALRGLPNGMGWVVLLCGLTWMNDTGAYFVGRLWGRHKLHPRVSPGKSWEGFVGGLVFSIGAAFAVKFLGLVPLRDLDVWVLGTVTGLVGPTGDLAESLLKRSFGAKDSGRLIPGHGGVLDRIDALLFNAPVVYFWALFATTGARA